MKPGPHQFQVLEDAGVQVERRAGGGVRPGHGQKFRKHLVHALEGAGNAAREVGHARAARLRAAPGFLDQELGVQAHGRHGIAEIVDDAAGHGARKGQVFGEPLPPLPGALPADQAARRQRQQAERGQQNRHGNTEQGRHRRRRLAVRALEHVAPEGGLHVSHGGARPAHGAREGHNRHEVAPDPQVLAADPDGLGRRGDGHGQVGAAGRGGRQARLAAVDHGAAFAHGHVFQSGFQRLERVHEPAERGLVLGVRRGVEHERLFGQLPRHEQAVLHGRQARRLAHGAVVQAQQQPEPGDRRRGR